MGKRTLEEIAQDTIADIESVIAANRSMGVGAHSTMHSVQRLAMAWQMREPSFLARLQQTIDEEDPAPDAAVPHPWHGDPRDWIEDATHENGGYQCRCIECGNLFVGHKRRVVCKVCSTPAAPVEGS